MDKKVFVILLAVLVILGVVLVIGLSVGLTRDKTCQGQQAQESAEKHRSASEKYRFAAVTSDSGVCSAIGTDILARHDGSAVDAAIATLVCLGVVNSQHSGVGGGHIMVLHERPKSSNEKQTMSLVSHPTAPLWVTPEYFEDEPESKNSGAKSISIPCEVKGYYAAWERYGRIPWAELFQPSIKLCFDGWKVTKSMADAIQRQLSAIRNDPMLEEAYIREDGKPYEAGDTMKAPRLGRTLQRIADEGPDTFYTGSLAEDIIDDIEDAGGIISQRDLASTKALWWSPSVATLQNGTYQLHVAPPPSSGLVTAFILKLLEQFPMEKGREVDADLIASRLHLLIEAWEIGFALRKQAIGDKAFQTRELIQRMNDFVDDDYVRRMARLVVDRHAADDYATLAEETDRMPTAGSTHLNVLAADGGAVSVTAGLGSPFGSMVRGNRTGLLFNNDLSLFDLPTETKYSVNYMYPRKRGQSAVTPVVVLNEKKEAALLVGSSGGTRAITSTSYVAALTLFGGRSVGYANSAPRLHAQFNTSVYYDEEMPGEILEKLAEKGHTPQVPARERFPYLGVNQVIDNRGCITCGIHCTEVCMEAVSDWRKAGQPDGY